MTVILLIKLTLSLAFLPDPSLSQCHDGGCPGWAVPYGVLWQWTNPYWWTQSYPTVALLLDIPITMLNSLMLSRRWFMAWLVTDWHWFMGFFSNVSITWFAAYPVIGPAWALLSKLPIGYWPLFNNAHVNCALNCGSGFNTGHVRLGNAVTYGIISIWTLVPTLLWARKRWVGRESRRTGASSAASPR